MNFFSFSAFLVRNKLYNATKMIENWISVALCCVFQSFWTSCCAETLGLWAIVHISQIACIRKANCQSEKWTLCQWTPLCSIEYSIALNPAAAARRSPVVISASIRIAEPWRWSNIDFCGVSDCMRRPFHDCWLSVWCRLCSSCRLSLDQRRRRGRPWRRGRVVEGQPVADGRPSQVTARVRGRARRHPALHRRRRSPCAFDPCPRPARPAVVRQRGIAADERSDVVTDGGWARAARWATRGRDVMSAAICRRHRRRWGGCQLRGDCRRVFAATRHRHHHRALSVIILLALSSWWFLFSHYAMNNASSYNCYL